MLAAFMMPSWGSP